MIGRAAVSLLAIAWAGGAAAQTPPANAGGPPDASDVGSSDEIIVTAQRRSERLVDVPLSVVAVGGDELERAGGESLESLNKLVPGVYMQRDVYGLSPTVRGIGSTLSSSGGESNVSVYVDGVYVPYKATNIFDLASVSGVQVLKGPQGTLFGRNATGGAILVSTLDPSFEPEARLRLSYERFGTARASGYVNVPIAHTLAVNAAVAYRHSDGYIRDSRTGEIVNEGEDFAARVKLLYEPTNDLSFVLTGYHSRFDDPTGSSYQVVETVPFFLLPGIDANSGPLAYDRFRRSHNTEDEVRTGTDQYSLHVNWDVGFGAIQSISSYQNSDLYSRNDLDNTYQTLVPALDASVDFMTDSRVFTQEVNFTSDPGSTFEYVTGLFYFSNRGSVPPAFLISGDPSFDSVGRSEAVSAYFDGSYHIGNWVLIGGLRYTQEDRENTTRFYSGGVPVLSLTSERTEDVWTPRVGVRYEITPDSNVYATYTRGYKAGIFDATSPTGNAVDPEFVDAYEIGYKVSSPDFTLNTAAYYYDFTDTQVNAVFSSGTAVFQQLFNVPQSEIYGFDIDGTYRFNDAWDIRGSLAYTHARYENFTNAPSYQIATSGPLAGLIQEAISIDASGNRMVRAPDWTASGAINYHANLGGEARLDASLAGFYTSRVYFTFDNELSQGAYFLMDANATVTFNEHVTVSLFGRNLTDEIYYTRQSDSALTVASGTFGMPRTYGVSIGYTF